MSEHSSLPDPHICEHARLSRDARFDGLFFTAVSSTGIYCRPVCPAPTTKRENVRYYANPAAAEAAGFRPCLRCRPELAPGNEQWQRGDHVVARALKLIEAGALAEQSLDELARRAADQRAHDAPVAVRETAADGDRAAGDGSRARGRLPQPAPVQRGVPAGEPHPATRTAPAPACGGRRGAGAAARLSAAVCVRSIAGIPAYARTARRGTGRRAQLRARVRPGERAGLAASERVAGRRARVATAAALPAADPTARRGDDAAADV